IDVDVERVGPGERDATLELAPRGRPVAATTLAALRLVERSQLPTQEIFVLSDGTRPGWSASDAARLRRQYAATVQAARRKTGAAASKENAASADADDAYRKKIVRHIRSLCDAAREHGMTVSTEFHGGTLTDHYESCVRLIGEVECDNFCTYWQPNQFRDEDYNIAALNAVLPWLSNVHVFTWAGHNKYPLIDGAERWKRYIDILRTNGGSHHMLMEFVCDDTVEQFYRDAETLLDWLR
ncbi:MAG: hypothetical protein IJV76_04720, partial [Clostridia bacterium]|nr:hypothetical protein [Clostridia bacterium]